MRRTLLIIRQLCHDSRAATAVEYGLIVALMVLAMLGGLQLFADSTIGMWNNVSTKVASAR